MRSGSLVVVLSLLTATAGCSGAAPVKEPLQVENEPDDEDAGPSGTTIDGGVETDDDASSAPKTPDAVDSARIAITATQYSSPTQPITNAYELRAQGFMPSSSCTRNVVDSCEIDSCKSDLIEPRPFEAGIISFGGGSLSVRELNPAKDGKYETPSSFPGIPFTSGNEITATWPGTVTGAPPGTVKAKAPPFMNVDFDPKLFSTTENMVRMPNGPFQLTWVPRQIAGLDIEVSFVSDRPTGPRLFATCRFDAGMGAGAIRQSVLNQLLSGKMEIRAVQRATVRVGKWNVGIELRTIRRDDGWGTYKFRAYET